MSDTQTTSNADGNCTGAPSETTKSKAKRKPSGYVLWEGDSPIDGAPIVAIATTKSSNAKTGNMLQTWILRRDMSPVEAVKTDADRSICGDCPLRGSGGKDRACYVVWAQAPQSIYHAYRRGSYPKADFEDAKALGRDRHVRLGAYGDPALVPFAIWNPLLVNATGWTGYTHLWRLESDLEGGFELKGILMASVEDIVGAKYAQANGWRTFRVGRPDWIDPDISLKTEIPCPSAKVKCSDCNLCRGASLPAKSITIEVHGRGKSKFNVEQS